MRLTNRAERYENPRQPVSGAVRLPGEPAQYNQGAAADAELAENVLEMFLDGVFHDTELPGHLSVGESLAQKPDDLLLAFGEHIRAVQTRLLSAFVSPGVGVSNRSDNALGEQARGSQMSPR